MSRFKKFLVIYAIGAIASWFAISGWEFADSQARFPRIAKENMRYDSGFAAMHAVWGAALWPIALPAMYCLTGYAEHGWRPVWKLRD